MKNLNSDAIETLKRGMTDRVATHFDPLLMTGATLDTIELLSLTKKEATKQKLSSLYAFAKNTFSTGNVACNLNVILQNQNLALTAENIRLKEENENLKKNIP